MYSKVKVGGHPIHPMLVAFPVASYVGTLVAFAVYVANAHLFWLNIAIALSIVGVGSAVLAALPGFIDWAFGIPRRSGAKLVGFVHALCNVTALALFLVAVATYATDWNGPAVDATLGLAVSAAGVAVTLVAGALGWRLVQTYHVGVLLTPEQPHVESAVQAIRPVLHLGHRRKTA